MTIWRPGLSVRRPIGGTRQRWGLGRPYDWLWAVLAIALAVQGARLAWAVVTPVTPLGDWAPRGPEILDPQARIALLSSFDPFNRQAAGTAGPAVAVTSAPLTLFGIRLNQGTGAGSAIIAAADGVQKSVLVGQEIEPGVTLQGVAFDHVTINRGGAVESLYLDQSVAATQVGGAPAAGSAATPAPASVSAPASPPAAAPAPASLTPAAIRAGIGFAPRSDGGRVTGIVVAPQGDGSIFRAAGFRPGDIITAINGRPVSGAQDGANFASQLQPGARLSVSVERGANTVPIAIIIPEE